MSNEKRFFLFIVLMFLWMMAFPYVMRLLGLNPPPKKPPAAAAAVEAAKKGEPEKKGEAETQDEDGEAKAQGRAAPRGGEAEPAKRRNPPRRRSPRPVTPQQSPRSPWSTSRAGPRLRDRYLAGWLSAPGPVDPEGGRRRVALLVPLSTPSTRTAGPSSGPLQLIEKERDLARLLHADPQCDRRRRGRRPPPPRPTRAWRSPRARPRTGCDAVTWEVVRDEQGRIRRPVSMTDPATGTAVEGQAIVFRTKAPNGVVVTKTFRLGKNIDGLEVELQFDSPDKERKVVYNLRGPHGIPIEGEWYTSTFLDLFFGQLDQGRIKMPDTYAAIDVAKAGDKPIENTALPLRLCGRGEPVFRHLDGARSRSRPARKIDGTAGRWRLAAPEGGARSRSRTSASGSPRSRSPLVPGTAGRPHLPGLRRPQDRPRRCGPTGPRSWPPYRKNQWIPYAPEIARYVIAPTLDMMYRLTESVAQAVRRQEGQLRHRDHPADHAGPRPDVPARPQAGAGRPEDAGAPAAHEGDPGEVQGGQGAADQGDVRPLQEVRRQSDGRLLAGPDPVADLRRALAGASTPASRCGTRRSSGSATSPRPT